MKVFLNWQRINCFESDEIVYFAYVTVTLNSLILFSDLVLQSNFLVENQNYVIYTIWFFKNLKSELLLIYF